MRAVFDAERDRWMDEEEAEWLSLVKPYPNVISALRHTEVRPAAWLLTLELHSSRLTPAQRQGHKLTD